MNLLREYIRSLLVESTDRGKLFTSEIDSRFEPRPGGAMAVSFQDGCEVRFVISDTFLMPFGPDDSPHAQWDSIQTLGPGGVEDTACFQKGYARKAMEQVVSIADKHGITLILRVAAFGEKSSADNDTLIKFYSSLGFVTPDSGPSGMMKRVPR